MNDTTCPECGHTDYCAGCACTDSTGNLLPCPCRTGTTGYEAMFASHPADIAGYLRNLRSLLPYSPDALNHYAAVNPAKSRTDPAEAHGGWCDYLTCAGIREMTREPERGPARPAANNASHNALSGRRPDAAPDALSAANLAEFNAAVNGDDEPEPGGFPVMDEPWTPGADATEPAPAGPTITGCVIESISSGRDGKDYTITFYCAGGETVFYKGTALACLRQLNAIQPQIAVLDR